MLQKKNSRQWTSRFLHVLENVAFNGVEIILINHLRLKINAITNATMIYANDFFWKVNYIAYIEQI